MWSISAEVSNYERLNQLIVFAQWIRVFLTSHEACRAARDSRALVRNSRVCLAISVLYPAESN